MGKGLSAEKTQQEEAEGIKIEEVKEDTGIKIEEVNKDVGKGLKIEEVDEDLVDDLPPSLEEVSAEQREQEKLMKTKEEK